MKKLLIYLSLLFSMFLFIFIPGFKVSASEPISTVGTNIYNLKDCTYFTYTEEQIDNLITTAKAKLTEKGVNADDFNKFNLVVHKWTYGNEINFYLYNDYDIDNNRITFNLTENSSVPLTVFYQNTNGYIKYSKRNAVDPDKLVYSSFTSSKTNVNISFQYFENNDGSGVYILTNFDLINKSNEVIISQNFNVEPKKYHEVINSRKYSKVEFVFDVPNMEANLNFNYDFHLVDSTGNLDTLNTFKSPYFEETYTSCGIDESGASYCKPLPVVDNFAIEEASDGQCHIDDFGLNNCYKPIDYSSKLNVYNSYIVKNYDLLINNNINKKMTTKLKLILDLEFNSSVYVDATFYSSLSYEIKYYERTTTLDYYSTIDLTGKYGALFIPKFDNLEDSLTIRTLFKGIGHLDIQHRSSYDYINYQILSAYSMNYCNEYLYNQDAIPYSCSEFSGEYEFYVSNNNLEQALFFVNSAYENETSSNVSITYDTRYYVYYVFDTPTSIVAVVNPNTGDKTYISLDDFYNYVDVDSFFLNGLVNQFYIFFNEKFPVVSQFKMIINLFNFNEDYDDPPVLKVSLNSIGIDEEVQIVDFSIFNQYRSTVIFWEMLFLTTYTVVKVTNNVVKAFKGD